VERFGSFVNTRFIDGSIKRGERHDFEDGKKYTNDIREYIIKYFSMRTDLRCICLSSRFHRASIGCRWDKRVKTGEIQGNYTIGFRHGGRDERIVDDDLGIELTRKSKAVHSSQHVSA
jgi:hypothetical protein